MSASHSPPAALSSMVIICLWCAKVVEAHDALFEKDRHAHCEMLVTQPFNIRFDNQYDAGSSPPSVPLFERSRLAAYNFELRGATARCRVCRGEIQFLPGTMYTSEHDFDEGMIDGQFHQECEAPVQLRQLKEVADTLREYEASEVRGKQDLGRKYDKWEADLRRCFGGDVYELALQRSVEGVRTSHGASVAPRGVVVAEDRENKLEFGMLLAPAYELHWKDFTLTLDTLRLMEEQHLDWHDMETVCLHADAIDTSDEPGTFFLHRKLVDAMGSIRHVVASFKADECCVSSVRSNAA